MSIVTKTDKRGYTSFYLDGKRLPSPSSICSRFKDSGGLIYWANQEGLEGRTLDEARKAATTPGSYVHARIEADIRGHDFDHERWAAKIAADGLDIDEVLDKALQSWNAYQDWKAESKVDVVAAEVSLGSEAHRFGGTLDAVAVTSGLFLVDWKTGALYPDHVLQMGGYVILWEENFPDRPLDGVKLLSISKEHGGFTQVSLPRETMQPAVNQFLLLRDAWDNDKILKKLV